MPERLPVSTLSYHVLYRIAVNVCRWVEHHLKRHPTCPFTTNKCRTMNDIRQQIEEQIPNHIKLEVLYTLVNYFFMGHDKYSKVRLCTLNLFWTDSFKDMIIRYEKEFRDLTYHYFKHVENITVSVSRDSKIYIPYKGEKLDLFNDMIYSTTKLNVLKIDCVVGERTLGTIGWSCSQLQELQLYADTEIFDTGSGFLRLTFKDYPKNETVNPLCLTLKSLEIWSTLDDDPHGVRQVIDTHKQFMDSACLLLENLHVLKNLGLIVGGHVLKRLSDDCRHFSPFLEAITDSFTDSEVASVYSDFCENISSITVHHPKDGEFLESLKFVTGITHLKILGFLSKSDEAMDFLSYHPKLVQLHIGYVKGNFDFSKVAEQCPNLEQLGIGATSYSYSDKIPMINLKTLDLDKFWNDSNFLHLLSNAPNLEDLKIIESSELSDSHVDTIIHIGTAFRKLKTVRFKQLECDNFNLSTLQKFVNYCPKLKYFSTFPYQKNERENLKKYFEDIERTNLNFKLIHVMCFE